VLAQIEDRLLAFDGDEDGRLSADEFRRAAARFVRARNEADQECYREQQTITLIRKIWVAKLDEVAAERSLRLEERLAGIA